MMQPVTYYVITYSSAWTQGLHAEADGEWRVSEKSTRMKDNSRGPLTVGLETCVGHPEAKCAPKGHQ